MWLGTYSYTQYLHYKNSLNKFVVIYVYNGRLQQLGSKLGQKAADVHCSISGSKIASCRESEDDCALFHDYC